MALSDRVTARLSTTRLVSLTNPDAPHTTNTVDTTRLAAACADAEAEFEAVVGAEYDDTDTRHHAVAVLAVEWKLLGYSGTRDEAWTRAEKSFLEAAERLALTRGGRARIAPTTNSLLTPSSEVPEGREVRPDFDRGDLGIFLRPPRGGSAGFGSGDL